MKSIHLLSNILSGLIFSTPQQLHHEMGEASTPAPLITSPMSPCMNSDLSTPVSVTPTPDLTLNSQDLSLTHQSNNTPENVCEDQKPFMMSITPDRHIVQHTYMDTENTHVINDVTNNNTINAMYYSTTQTPFSLQNVLKSSDYNPFKSLSALADETFNYPSYIKTSPTGILCASNDFSFTSVASHRSIANNDEGETRSPFRIPPCTPKQTSSDQTANCLNSVTVQSDSHAVNDKTAVSQPLCSEADLNTADVSFPNSTSSSPRPSLRSSPNSSLLSSSSISSSSSSTSSVSSDNQRSFSSFLYSDQTAFYPVTQCLRPPYTQTQSGTDYRSSPGPPYTQTQSSGDYMSSHERHQPQGSLTPPSCDTHVRLQSAVSPHSPFVSSHSAFTTGSDTEIEEHRTESRHLLSEVKRQDDVLDLKPVCKKEFSVCSSADQDIEGTFACYLKNKLLNLYYCER